MQTGLPLTLALIVLGSANWQKSGTEVSEIKAAHPRSPA